MGNLSHFGVIGYIELYFPRCRVFQQENKILNDEVIKAVLNYVL